MKVSIQDREVYQTLKPADVAAYLHSANWQPGINRPGHSSMWHTTYEGEPVELLLPLNRQFKDYVVRMAETVPLIAAVEKRSELEVLSDIQTAGSDVVRVRYHFASAQDGSIPLDRGEALIENVREIFLAGACAVLSKRPHFANMKAQQARDYVQTLRLGQSERGSYVLKVLSPVPPQLNPCLASAPGLNGETEPPFARLAVTQISHALAALRSAADEAMSSFQSDVFDRAVQQGVSANLCTALVNIGGLQPQSNDELVFSFSWARSRPADPKIVREIAFPGDLFPIIGEAARLYKVHAPPEETELLGFVVKLQSTAANGTPAGPITLSTVLEGRQRKVTIHLSEPDHAKAIHAYHDGSVISCRGTLAKHGAIWTLQDPGRVTILGDE